MRLSEKIKEAFKRFPARFLETLKRFSGTAVLVVLLYLLSAIVAHEALNIDPEAFWVLGLGAIALVAADLFFETHPLKWYWAWGIKLLLLALLVLASFSLLRYELRPILLLGATIALFGWAVCRAFHSRGEETLGVLIIRGATALLFAVVLFAGASLILAGTDLLLFSVHSRAFGEVARFSFVLFAPLMFLYGIPKRGEEKSLLRGYQQLLKVVVLPLLGIFMAVLYCYYIKLAVNRQLPISELGGVSLAFLCINLPMVLLAKPFCEGAIAKLRSGLLYGTLPVFAALFFTAGWQVAFFGVSVIRYIVLVGGLALLVCVLLMTLFKGKYRFGVFLVLLVTALIAAYGPQSCYSLTQWSQHGRLVEALAQAQMLDGGAVVPNPDAPMTLKREILELIDYCRQEDLKLPDCFPIPDNYYELDELLGFSYSDLQDGIGPEIWHNYPTNEPIDLGEGSYLLSRGGSYQFEAPYGVLKAETADGLVLLCDDKVLCSLNRDELRQDVWDAVSKEDAAASYIYTVETEEVVVKIPFDYISEPNPEPFGEWNYIYIKVKE